MSESKEFVASGDDLGAPIRLDVAARKPAHPHLVVGLLTGAYAVAFMDRSIFNLLLDPIKAEFGLSDAVIGLIAGFGFSLVQTGLGLVVGRIADTCNRVLLLSSAMFFWSVLTSATAFATSVVQLTLCRLGVAAGESALHGPAQSIIADRFPVATRSRALAIYSCGPHLGIFMGFLSAGWVSQHYGWQAAFFVCGLPGILLALALRLIVAEPTRGSSDTADVDAQTYSFRQTLSFLLRQRSFVLCLIGFCLTSYTNFALSVWVPSFLRRIHHLSSVEVGTYAGTIKGVVGVSGGILGGYLVAALKPEQIGWRLKLPALASICAAPVLLAFFLSADVTLALFCLSVGSFLMAIHIGPVYAAVQAVAKVRMRSFASSALVLGASLFGSGLAPLLIGLLNDALAPQFGGESIRYSLISAAVTSVAGAVCFWIASRRLAEDAQRSALERL